MWAAECPAGREKRGSDAHVAGDDVWDVMRRQAAGFMLLLILLVLQVLHVVTCAGREMEIPASSSSSLDPYSTHAAPAFEVQDDDDASLSSSLFSHRVITSGLGWTEMNYLRHEIIDSMHHEAESGY